MKVLIACEFSGIVRDAFIASGHEAWSCDILPTEAPGPHILADVLSVLTDKWDLMVAFPPCTHLASSGARWFRQKRADGSQQKAIAFVRKLLEAPIEKIAVENPIGILSTVIRRPDQILQPWQFAHGETKATCLWLKGLPLLQPTKIVEGRYGRAWRESPSAERWKNRSRTYAGIASAMAAQWGRDTEFREVRL